MLQFANNEDVLEACKKDDKQIVIYKSKIYDITKFIKIHPGGKKVIQPHIGKPIDEPFGDQEHSDTAKSYFGTRVPQVGIVLDKDLASKLEIEIDTKYKRSFCCSRKYLIKKLFTKEDPIFLHKTFGLLSLLSFIYRYFYIFPMTGNLGFDESWFDYLTLAIHMILSTSSIIFHVLPQRMLKRPLVIWHEYRLHAIVFTLRCISVAMFAAHWPKQNNGWDNVSLFCTVMVHHLVVDEITRRYGPGDPNQTTVRGKTDGKKSSNNFALPKSVTLGYAFYQFSAIGAHLVPNARLMDLGYNSLIAIQSSAFLMTLFRKGLIRWYTHASWYSLALIMSLMVMYNHLPLYFWAKIAVCFYARVKLRMNKYIIWILYSIFSLAIVENTIFTIFN